MDSTALETARCEQGRTGVRFPADPREKKFVNIVALVCLVLYTNYNSNKKGGKANANLPNHLNPV